MRIEIIRCKCGAAVASSATLGAVAWHKRVMKSQKDGLKVQSYEPQLAPPIEECRCSEVIPVLPNQIDLFK